MIHFTIPGAPKGKARPRVTKFGTYTPKSTKDYEKLVRKSYLDAGFPVRKCLETPLCVNIRAYFPVSVLCVIKTYDGNPRTEVTIFEVKENEIQG